MPGLLELSGLFLPGLFGRSLLVPGLALLSFVLFVLVLLLLPVLFCGEGAVVESTTPGGDGMRSFSRSLGCCPSELGAPGLRSIFSFVSASRFLGSSLPSWTAPAFIV